MGRRSLHEFVVDAHRNGYAAGGGESTADGVTRIAYRDGDWRYVDRYYGSRASLGSEVVSFDAEPVWGMHYSGEPIDPAVDRGVVYEVLRDALDRCTADRPYRGPARFESGPFVYRGQFGGGRIE